MSKFSTVTIEHKTTMTTNGMSIKAFIAGVNSGEYGLPFVIQVSTWASKWGFKKFFYREMKLNIFEMRALKAELDKAIQHFDSKPYEL